MVVTLRDALGLHARPAARLIRVARRFQARVTVEDVTKHVGPVDAGSMNRLLALGARQGDQLLIRAQGHEARDAVAEIARALEQVSELPAVGRSPEPRAADQLAGIPASAGIGIGPVVRLQAAAVRVEPRVVDDTQAEERRLQAAIHHARDETRALYEWAKTHTGANEAAIFDAQLLFLEDPELVGEASRAVLDERLSAEYAWQSAAGRLRAGDVPDVAARVLRILMHRGIGVPALTEPSILVAHDLTPSEVKELDPDLTLGLCLETGSASAHSVILARAIGIPAVVGLGPAISTLAEGATVALDGERGSVWVSPTPAQVAILNSRREEWIASRAAAQAERHKPACTRDGRRIRVLANINGVEEAAAALEYGAEGVGVLRTEFLFLGRTSPPGEEEQYAAYRAIAETLGSRPLVIRTLDIGGDKNLPYIDIGEEANPFLGWRGIRVTLGRQDLLRTQLRAILRAGDGHRVEILLPMVSSLDELRQVKSIVGQVQMPIGVMIEVPAAVAIADQLAREAAFFSIGTNDLVQYVMAADRTNARVAPIADPLQPAVLRMMRQAIEAARGAGIPVTLCGELAADTLATPLLLGMGLTEFSVSAPLIPELKRAISRWSMAEAEAAAERVLAMDSCAAVREFLGSR